MSLVRLVKAVDPMSSRLDGAVVVVAGAGGAVGAAVVHRLARDGAVVVAAGRGEGRLRALAEDVERAGGQASAHVVDFLDVDALRLWVGQLREQHGHVDGLVHLVGGFVSSPTFAETDLAGAEALYQQVMGTLARATLAFHEVLAESPSARFAMVSAVAAATPSAGGAAYAAAKAASEAWTLAMADSFAGLVGNGADGPAAVVFVIKAIVTEQMRRDGPGKAFAGFTSPEVLADRIAELWDRPAPDINGVRIWLTDRLEPPPTTSW